MTAHTRMFGAHLPIAGGRPMLGDIERVVGRRLDLIMLFGKLDGATVPSFFTIEQCLTLGLRPILTVEPRVALADVAAGRFDDNLIGWATALARFGERLCVRFGHEMNGDWYPWGRKYVTPEVYIAAWRRARDIFATLAPTVQWLWCPNRQYDRHSAIEPFYPGDDYVDRVGVDAYNRSDPWRSPVDTAVPTLTALRALAPSKPIVVAEFGCAPKLERAAWMAEWWRTMDWSPVSWVLAFYDLEVSRAWDWRWGHDPIVTEAFQQGLARWKEA